MSSRLLAITVALVIASGWTCARAEPAPDSSASGLQPIAASPAAHAPDDAPAPTLPPPKVRVWQMGLLRADRMQHASFAFTSGIMIGLMSEQPFAAAGGSLALGVAKELWDVHRTGFDVVDLLADALGAASATAATITVTR